MRIDLEGHGCMVHSGYKTCALHLFHDSQLNANKNANRLESR